MGVKLSKWRYAFVVVAIALLAGLGWVFIQFMLPSMSSSGSQAPYVADSWLMNYRLDLEPQRGILIESMRKVDDRPLNETPLAAYYTKAELDARTETSFARRIRQVSDTTTEGFAWYQDQQEQLLYRFGAPYTGWYGQKGTEWQYFYAGQLRPQYTLSQEEARQYANTATFLQAFVPSYEPKYIYLKPMSETYQFVDRDTIRYSILNRGLDGVLLSNIPGDANSYFVANTSKYYDIPMEVVEEAVVDNQTWLHVNIGYKELGWIPKDTSYQQYVLTNYSERRLIDTVEQILEEEVGSIQGMVGASFIDNETMAQVDVDNQIFFPASTQKIYVLAELYRQYKAGTLSPDDRYIMAGDNIVPGAGHINEQPEGTEFSLDELVDMVAIYSDNTAANMLITAVGGGQVITPNTHELGMYDTYLEGKYYNADNGRFQTTPHDAALLFAKLANHEVNGEPWDSMLIDKLRLNTHSFLRTYLYDTDSWNKSGLGDPEQNDVATFVTRYGSFSIAVYTNSYENYNNRFDEVGRLASRVYEAFNEIRSDLWHPYDPAQGFYR